jgi:GNAT superfamily N-acetyltransferase
MQGFAIQPLTAHFKRETFSCGITALDRYLKQQAGQDARKLVAAPFILVEVETNTIAGFYTLSATSIQLSELPATLAHKLPKYPLLPATLLGRLAVDLRYRGKGLGELLLMDALHRSLRMSHEIASMAVVVEAKDKEACEFYLRYHFIPLSQSPYKLFLTMTTIQHLFED